MNEIGIQAPDVRVERFGFQVKVFGDRAEEMKPVLEDITDKILYREKRMFESRGATSGVYWAPLHRATVLWKQQQGMPHVFSPLRGTDSLMLSLSKRGARFQHLRIDNHGIQLATRHPAAGYHASGTSEMPRRPPLIIPAKHAREYIKDLNDFIFGTENA